MIAPEATVFTSTCVDVIRIDIERFRIVARPCRPRCYSTVSCPDWDRALGDLGGWVQHAVPERTVVDVDGTEEFVIGRASESAVPAA